MKFTSEGGSVSVTVKHSAIEVANRDNYRCKNIEYRLFYFQLNYTFFMFLCFHILFLFLFSFFISIFIFVFKFCFELIFWQDATINLPFFPPYFFHLFLSWKIFTFLLYFFCFMSSFATFYSQFLINFFHFFPLLIHVSHSYFICVFIDLI